MRVRIEFNAPTLINAKLVQNSEGKMLIPSNHLQRESYSLEKNVYRSLKETYFTRRKIEHNIVKYVIIAKYEFI